MAGQLRFLRSFAVELAIYAMLVVCYFLLVLHFVAAWVERLYREETRLYAAVAIALMIGQGVVLEMLTTALLRFIRRRAG